MVTILLKSKGDPVFTDVKIVDDIITGLLQGIFYVPVFHPSAPGVVLHSIEFLIENYWWPRREWVPQSRIENFIIGHNPTLAKTIGHYEVEDYQ
jgi:hypothetical protein